MKNVQSNRDNVEKSQEQKTIWQFARCDETQNGIHEKASRTLAESTKNCHRNSSKKQLKQGHGKRLPKLLCYMTKILHADDNDTTNNDDKADAAMTTTPLLFVLRKKTS